jgi:hypothetical protein
MGEFRTAYRKARMAACRLRFSKAAIERDDPGTVGIRQITTPSCRSPTTSIWRARFANGRPSLPYQSLARDPSMDAGPKRIGGSRPSSRHSPVRLDRLAGGCGATLS